MKHTSPRRILQKPNIDLRPRQHNIAHHTTTDKHVLHGGQMRVFIQIQNVDIIQLNVQVLVDGFESAADANVVLEFDGHRLVGKSLEEAAK